MVVQLSSGTITGRVFPFHLSEIIDNEFVDSNQILADYILPNGTWNIDKLQSILPDDVVKSIKAINIPLTPTEDTFVWGPTPNGKFSIKSATHLQLNNVGTQRSLILSKVWKLKLPPKIKLFAWLLLQRKLSTRNRLAKYQSVEDICPFCNFDSETPHHLFRACLYSSKIWNALNSFIPIVPPCNIDWSILNWNVQFPLLIEKVIAVCWKIWYQRNNFIFQNKHPTVLEAVNHK